jgi:multidrug efflux pump
MYFLNFSINTFTLLAMTLSIGLVVDDTIVVLENIVRHIEMGKKPIQAALDGTSEIGFAVLSTTFTLIAVFVPIGLMAGTVGRLFYEFAFTVAISVGISGFVSLSLAPMLCSRMLQEKAAQKDSPRDASEKNRFSRFFSRMFSKLPESYHHGLRWSLLHPKTIISMAVLFIAIAIGVTKFIPSDFLPVEDRGLVLTIVKSPEGSTLDYTDKAVRQGEAILKNTPAVSSTFAAVALDMQGIGQVNEGIMFSNLHPWEERTTPDKKQQNVVVSLLPKMMSVPEAFLFPINIPSGPASDFSGAVKMVLQGDNLKELNDYSEAIVAKASKIPGLVNLDTNLKLNKPQIQVNILRERAEALGVSPKDVSRVLQSLMGSLKASDFKLNNKRYDVIMQSEKQYRNLPQAINTMTIKNNMQHMIPLSNLVQIKEGVSISDINHYNRERSVTISAANIPFLLTLGGALDQLEDIAYNQVHLPKHIRVTYSGQSREFKDAGLAVYFTFGFAILFIYLILAAQFESFTNPFVILLTVPLAVAGAILTLFYFNTSINIYSQIGMVLLIGLVTKNGILIVEYANTLSEQGLSTFDSIYQASVIRLRPILMTSLAMVFGTLPIALGLGASSEARQGLGLAVVGGLIFSTFLTLFLIPVVYQLLKKRD